MQIRFALSFFFICRFLFLIILPRVGQQHSRQYGLTSWGVPGYYFSVVPCVVDELVLVSETAFGNR